MTDVQTASIWEASGADRLYDVLPAPLDFGTGMPQTDVILRTLHGEAVLERVWDAFSTGGGGAVGLLGRIGGMLVICAVFKKYRASLGDGDNDLLAHCMMLVLALIGFEALADTFADAAAYFGQIHTAVTAALTTLTALSVMRGAVQSAAVTGMGMALFLSAAETVCSGVLFPFLRFCTGLSLASAVGGGEAPAQLSGLLRKQFLWIVGGLMTLLCAVLSYQTVLARASDSVAMRAVRFTLSGAVPIIGGAVGEAASTVAAGFSLAGKTVGVLGVAAVLWQILPTLISVYLTRLSFSVSASVARMLDMKDEEGVLAECAAIAGFLLAVVSAAAILYILMLTLCMNGG